MNDACLSFQSAWKILDYVAKHNGVLTWHNIVRHIDQLEVAPIPPPYHVLQALVKEGYLTRDTVENQNTSKYLITETGRQLLVGRMMAKAA
jgi:Fe2+ or Zn2+ uptake regulation protein